MPVIIAIDIPIRSDERERAIESFKNYMIHTRSEPGNICFHVYEDIEKQNTFHMYEEYSSQDALAVHHESQEFKVFIVFIKSLAGGAPILRKYEATAIANTV